MICLEISINEKMLWRVGVENASILSASVSSFVGDENFAELDVHGMCDLPSERSAHVYWGEVVSLQVSDSIRIAMVESANPSSPTILKATDSPEYIEEQRQFEKHEHDYRPATTPAIRRWPSVAFQCSVNGEHQATATLAPDEEHIVCMLVWNRWSADYCRLSVRSFGGSVNHDDQRETEWLRANLFLNDVMELHLHKN